MPAQLNPTFRKKFVQTDSTKDVAYYIEGIKQGNRVILGQAITLIESQLSEHFVKAQQIVEVCMPLSGNAQRIGITGSPGVGKSTFIEALGIHAIAQKRKVAVLAVDPSSQRNKGSILGDKTRMQSLSTQAAAFIRPSPAGDSLGGVAQKTRESIILCEAAGFDTVLVETVGVGQSEIAVHSMVDCFLLLLLPGAGDELQGIKRGIVEMSDLVCINKAEKERLQLAQNTKKAYRNALHLFPQKESEWTTRVHLISALEQVGIAEVWQQLQLFFQHINRNGFQSIHRQSQIEYWFQESLDQQLKQWFFEQPDIKSLLPQLKRAALQHEISPFHAARTLVERVK